MSDRKAARRPKCTGCSKALVSSAVGWHPLVAAQVHTCTGCSKVLCPSCRADPSVHGVCLAMAVATDAAKTLGEGLGKSGKRQSFLAPI